jgi:hypothetical protein
MELTEKIILNMLGNFSSEKMTRNYVNAFEEVIIEQ